MNTKEISHEILQKIQNIIRDNTKFIIMKIYVLIYVGIFSLLYFNILFYLLTPTFVRKNLPHIMAEQIGTTNKPFSKV